MGSCPIPFAQDSIIAILLGSLIVSSVRLEDDLTKEHHQSDPKGMRVQIGRGRKGSHKEELLPVDTLTVRLPRRVTGVTAWVSREGIQAVTPVPRNVLATPGFLNFVRASQWGARAVVVTVAVRGYSAVYKERNYRRQSVT